MRASGSEALPFLADVTDEQQVLELEEDDLARQAGFRS